MITDEQILEKEIRFFRVNLQSKQDVLKNQKKSL